MLKRQAMFRLGGFWLLPLPAFGCWLWQDQVTAPWDMSNHALQSLQLWEYLARGSIDRVYKLSGYYPPLFHLIAAPFSVISTHPDIYCLANWIFLLALMLGTWRLGHALAGQTAGLAAALILPAYSYVAWMARMPMTDLALTACVAWTLWLLTRRKGLSDGRQAHALGIWLGLGLLAKWSFVIFIGPPLIIYLWREARRLRDARGGGRLWRPFAWVIGWPLLLAGPWYWRALPELVKRVNRELSGGVARIEGDPAVFTLASFTSYLRHLYVSYMTMPLCLMFVAGVAALWWLSRRGWFARGERGAAWVTLGTAMGGGWLILTLIANKDARYILPLAPGLAVVSCAWIVPLRRGGRRAATWVVGVLAYATVIWNLSIFAPPDRRELGVERVAEWIIEHKPPGDEKVRVLVIPNEWILNSSALNYALARRDRKAEADHARKPLRARTMSRNDFVLVLEPAHDVSAVAPHVHTNTEFARSRADWRVVLRFERGDGREIVLLRPIDDARARSEMDTGGGE